MRGAAATPAAGIDVQRRRRGVDDVRALCSGPGKLCQALAITREHDGLPLDSEPFQLLARAREPDIVAGPRIGISQAIELPWRFGLAGSPFLSRPFNRRLRDGATAAEAGSPRRSVSRRGLGEL